MMAIIIYYLFFSNLQPVIEIDENNELTVVWEKPKNTSRNKTFHEKN
ncbi:hypothetical protein [Carnobacterium sp.]|nr:hypothetical protein [Carnobacterium sp.]